MQSEHAGSLRSEHAGSLQSDHAAHSIPESPFHAAQFLYGNVIALGILNGPRVRVPPWQLAADSEIKGRVVLFTSPELLQAGNPLPSCMSLDSCTRCTPERNVAAGERDDPNLTQWPPKAFILADPPPLPAE